MILKQKVPLRDFSNYKIGGNANYFFEFKSINELIAAISEYKRIDSDLNSVFILGGGTNILFNDEGYAGLVLKNSLDSIETKDDDLIVSSGALVGQLTAYAIASGLSGLEWAGGLPGTIGGAIRGNAGAFGGETKDNLIEVTSLDIHSLEKIIRKNSECDFNYRQSIFKKDKGKNEVILSAKFSMKKGNIEEIESKTEEKIKYRKEKHPLEYPNIGSIFKNIPIEKVDKDVLEEFKNYIKNDPFPVLPVAKLIAEGGLIGRRAGDAQISEKHPNFIVNLGNAKSKDVLELIDIIKTTLNDKYKISLEEEIMIL